jgi:hypothetical protein
MRRGFTGFTQIRSLSEKRISEPRGEIGLMLAEPSGEAA